MHDLAQLRLIARDARDEETDVEASVRRQRAELARARLPSEHGIEQGHARSTRAKSSRAGKALTAKRIADGTTEGAGVAS